jgi:hypothetical protein
MKRFLYIIRTKHNDILGFGVCATPGRRLQNYVSHSACKQEFACLYYGNKTEIDALENFIKNEWMNIRLNINGKWKWEWIDPLSNKTVDDIVELVDNKIEGHPMRSVRKLHKELLPFTNYYSKSDITKDNLDHDPDKYLEPSLVL